MQYHVLREIIFKAPSGMPKSFTTTTSNLTSITIQWDDVECTERNSDITGYIIKFGQTMINVSSDMRQFTATELFPSTAYMFEIAAVSSNGTGPFSNVSGSTLSPEGNISPVKQIDFAITYVISDVGLLLNGQFLPNNSVVAWMEIGQGSASLFCLTNKMDCCNYPSDSGGWIFPNGSTVQFMSSSVNIDIFYQKNAILLQHQVGTQSVTDSGIFRCDIIDSNNEMQQMYIGVYPQPGTSEF